VGSIDFLKHLSTKPPRKLKNIIEAFDSPEIEGRDAGKLNFDIYVGVIELARGVFDETVEKPTHERNLGFPTRARFKKSLVPAL
jgi:hypothetical protein